MKLKDRMWESLLINTDMGHSLQTKAMAKAKDYPRIETIVWQDIVKGVNAINEFLSYRLFNYRLAKGGSVPHRRHYRASATTSDLIKLSKYFDSYRWQGLTLILEGLDTEIYTSDFSDITLSLEPLCRIYIDAESAEERYDFDRLF